MRYPDQSPPRTEYTKSNPLFRGKTLIDLEFTPSTVLYIKFLENEELNSYSEKPPLRTELFEVAGQLPPPPSFDSAASGEKSSEVGKAKAKMGMGGDKGKVVPSWLKLGGNRHSKSKLSLSLSERNLDTLFLPKRH